MSAIYSVFIIGDKVNADALETTMEQAGNWLRLGFNNYLIHSNYDFSADVYNRVITVLSGKDYILVSKLDPVDREGWMPTWVWHWLRARTPDVLAIHAQPLPNRLAAMP